MIGSLLWKEWREQRWIAAGIFGVYAVLVVTAYLASKHDGYEMAEGCIGALTFLVPGFVAMGTIAYERSRRTEETLRVLPVGRMGLFLCRVGGGVATMIVPLVAIQVICWGAHGAENVGLGLRVLFGEMGLMVALYMWTLALGARLRSEAALGLVNIGVLCASVFITSVCDATAVSWGNGQFENAVRQIVYELLPTGFMTLGADLMPMQSPVEMGTVVQCWVVQGLEIMPLMMLAYWRMNMVPGVRRAEGVGSAAVRASAMGRNRRMPILWKTWREARLLVMGFVALAAIFMVCAGGTIWWSIGLTRAEQAGVSGLRQAAVSMCVVVPGIFSVLVAVLMGVDIGMRDFENRLEEFWQSRPIRAGGYMGKRYFGGLLVLMPVLLIVPVMGLLYAPATRMYCPAPEIWAVQTAEMGGAQWYYSHYAYDVPADALQFLALYVPQALVIYGVAVLGATLTRRRVISLVIGIGAGLGLEMVLGISEMHDLARQVMITPECLVAYAGIMAAVTGVLGWAAVMSVKWEWRAWFERRIGGRETPAVAGLALHPRGNMF
jgi:ABC-type transport system involved in multi-copper enzyme maturation permease subunit